MTFLDLMHRCHFVNAENTLSSSAIQCNVIQNEIFTCTWMIICSGTTVQCHPAAPNGESLVALCLMTGGHRGRLPPQIYGFSLSLLTGNESCSNNYRLLSSSFFKGYQLWWLLFQWDSPKQKAMGHPYSKFSIYL